MSSQFILPVVLLITGSTMINFRVLALTDVEKSFEKNGIVPDVIFVAPKNEAIVFYPSGMRVTLGNKLTPTQVKDIPFVKYNFTSGSFYTLALVDPDVPSRAGPFLSEWKNWLVVNIPGSNVTSGETLAEYVGSAPSKNTDFHRYVFLVYQQPKLLKFDEQRLNNTSTYKRTRFSIQFFAYKYRLGEPIAGNFYLAKYDDYVPILRAQLGEK